MERKYYIDNLRWICILLLIPYHAAMCWNVWGETNYLFFGENTILSSFIWLISPWYMPLLMVLAGASARYSLLRRSVAEFIKERIYKLLFPLLLGILIIVEPITYFADCCHNNYSGGYFEHYKIFFGRITDLTGYDGGLTPGHLWFLLYLFIISLISLPIIKYLKYHNSCEKINVFLLLAAGFLPLTVHPILNFGGKSVAEYLIFYLLGYYFISNDKLVIEKVVKYRIYYATVFVLASAFNIYAGLLQGLDSIISTTIFYISKWVGILTILGFAKNKFDWHNKITEYLSKISFPFYIFHYIWLTGFQFYFSRYTDNFIVLFFVSILLSYLTTFAVCEIIRKFKTLIKNRKQHMDI